MRKPRSATYYDVLFALLFVSVATGFVFGLMHEAWAPAVLALEAMAVIGKIHFRDGNPSIPMPKIGWPPRRKRSG